MGAEQRVTRVAHENRARRTLGRVLHCPLLEEHWDGCSKERNPVLINELYVQCTGRVWGTEVALQDWSPPPGHRGRPSGMAPGVALEPLSNAVLGLAAAVIALAAFLLAQRSIVLVTQSRIAHREPLLTRRVYDVVQSSPIDPQPLARLGRFDRKLVRSILLRLALDLRGDTGDALSEAYRDLG